LLADDHSIVIEGLRRVLDPIYRVVGAVADGGALVAAAAALHPDVIVADVSMPGLNGIEAARQICQATPNVKVVFFTMHSDEVYAAEAFRAGGAAYVLKSSAGSEILTAIREVLAGRTYLATAMRSMEIDIRQAPRLTPRQRVVIDMAASGKSTKEIGAALHISPRTVEFHRYYAMKSLGVHTIAELVHYVIKHRIAPV
jgi:DNA-binding NarL/FixJ family response regulator